MTFPEEFFKGEEREGFFVEELMKRAWAAQLVVLSEVDKVCKRYQIRWYADSGTMLGAIRHKGFIPWDDDLDIHMLRKDYNRFIKDAAKDLPKGYVCFTVHNKASMTDMLARVSNRLVPDDSPEEMEKFFGFPYPCGIDICPVDYIPRDPDELSVFNSLIDMCLTLANIYDKGNANFAEKEESLRKVEEFTGIPVNRRKPIPQQLRIIADKICGMYDSRDADVMGYAIRQKDQPNYNWPKEAYKSHIDMPFENITVPVPAGYDDIMKSEYGADYMTPMQFLSHDYPFYKKFM